MWTITGDDVATKPRSDIYTKKYMFTVIWNSLGFHVIDKVLTDAKMESDYFATNFLGLREQNVFPTGRNPHAKRSTIHWDNGSIHTTPTTEEYIRPNDMIRVQHLPYSLD
jgi:hypothetical protein